MGKKSCHRQAPSPDPAPSSAPPDPQPPAAAPSLDRPSVRRYEERESNFRINESRRYVVDSNTNFHINVPLIEGPEGVESHPVPGKTSGFPVGRMRRGDFVEVTEEVAISYPDAPRRFFFVVGLDFDRFVGYPLPVQTGSYGDMEIP